jgi:hypothetical protein
VIVSGCFAYLNQLRCVTFETGSKLRKVKADAFCGCPSLKYLWNRFSFPPLYPRLTVPLSLIHQLKEFLLRKRIHITLFVTTFSLRRSEWNLFDIAAILRIWSLAGILKW